MTNEELQSRLTIALARVEEIAAEKADLSKKFDDLVSFRDSMVSRVTEVLQSGDPEQMAALAMEFLTPEQEKIRAEKLAQIEILQAEIAALS